MRVLAGEDAAAPMERGNTLLRRADRRLGPLMLRGARLLRRAQPLPAAPEAIGILCCAAIGDLVLAGAGLVPALRRRYPAARLALFHSTANAEAVPLLPDLDHAEEIRPLRPRDAVAALRRQQLDLLIDTSQWARFGAVLSAASGAGCTIGFRTEDQHRHFAYDIAVEHRGDRHEHANFQALLAPLGIGSMPRPVLRLAPAALAAAARLRRRPYIVCHPWPSGLRAGLKEWPEEAWRRLARDLVGLGYDVVFTGGGDDRARGAALLGPLGDLGEAVRDMTGRCSLMETAGVIELAAALVTVNTGIMHIGAALDVPLVALHGPTDPRRWGPLSDQAVILQPEGDDVAYLNLGWEYPPEALPCLARLAPALVLQGVLDVTALADSGLRSAGQ
jgi:heptosyltransferase-3